MCRPPGMDSMHGSMALRAHECRGRRLVDLERVRMLQCSSVGRQARSPQRQFAVTCARPWRTKGREALASGSVSRGPLLQNRCTHGGGRSKAFVTPTAMRPRDKNHALSPPCPPPHAAAVSPTNLGAPGAGPRHTCGARARPDVRDPCRTLTSSRRNCIAEGWPQDDSSFLDGLVSVVCGSTARLARALAGTCRSGWSTPGGVCGPGLSTMSRALPSAPPPICTGNLQGRMLHANFNTGLMLGDHEATRVRRNSMSQVTGQISPCTHVWTRVGSCTIQHHSSEERMDSNSVRTSPHPTPQQHVLAHTIAILENRLWGT